MSGDNLIDNMSTKFRKLKNAENAVEKQELIAEIRADADILTKYLQQGSIKFSSKRKLDSMNIILNRCNEIEKQMNKQKKEMQESEALIQKEKMQKLSQYTLQQVIRYQLRKSRGDIDNIDQQQRQIQIKQIATRLTNCGKIMKDMNAIVISQDGKIQKIDNALLNVYNNVKDANREIQIGNQEQIERYLTNLKLALGGFFAVLGTKLFGWVGGVVGFVTGWKTI